jgi:hypothetical protein
MQTDQSLRLLCCAAVFVALGCLGHPNSMWGDYFRLIPGIPPKPTFSQLTVPVLAYAFIAWIVGAAIETGLGLLGFELPGSRIGEEDNYQDRLPPGSSGP